ncbi:MAG: hypothetical protein ACXVA2_15905 [Mucilaginibacter sp.]
MKMKLKPAEPKRIKRPNPQSFRFTIDSIKMLKALEKATGKNKTEIIEELISMAYRDTVRK